LEGAEIASRFRLLANAIIIGNRRFSAQEAYSPFFSIFSSLYNKDGLLYLSANHHEANAAVEEGAQSE